MQFFLVVREHLRERAPTAAWCQSFAEEFDLGEFGQ